MWRMSTAGGCMNVAGGGVADGDLRERLVGVSMFVVSARVLMQVWHGSWP